MIAQTHHEHWDGGGYPLGLRGEQIPIEGRITAVADVFDALSNKRPYKEAFPFDRCIEMMKRGRGTHFDPPRARCVPGGARIRCCRCRSTWQMPTDSRP